MLSMSAVSLQRGKRLGQFGHRRHTHTLDVCPWRIALGHDSPLETMLYRLRKTLLAIGHRTDLAGQSDLAEHYQICG